MKNLKVLGLAALIMAALMALAGSASATTVTTTTGGAASTPTIHLVSEGHFRMANAIATIECDTTSGGTVETHGSGLTAEVALTSLPLTGCTNSWHFTTEKPGVLKIHWTSAHNGAVTWSGALIKSTRFLVPCNYETNETKLGTLTGGNPATLHIEASIPVAAGSSPLCGEANAKWEGGLVTTSALYVAP